MLIPILIGMTPLNLFDKLSSPYPFSQGKQIQRASSCLFNSVVSQFDPNVVGSDSTPLELEAGFSVRIKVHDLIHSNISIISVPLRC
jgi:hypothetical protein